MDWKKQRIEMAVTGLMAWPRQLFAIHGPPRITQRREPMCKVCNPMTFLRLSYI